MICLKEKMLRALVDGELDSRTAARVQRHLENCGACRQKLDAVRMDGDWLRRSIAALDPLMPEPPPPLRLAAAPAPGARRPVWLRPLPVPSALVLAVIAVLLVMGATLLSRYQSLRDRQVELLATGMGETAPVQGQTINLHVGPGRLQVIEQPRVFIVKEEAHAQGI